MSLTVRQIIERHQNIYFSTSPTDKAVSDALRAVLFELDKNGLASLCATASWHDRPTCKGVWLIDFDDGRHKSVNVTDPSIEPSDRRWFGPIPTDPMRQ